MCIGFSVIIPCFNAEDFICDCLSSINRTRYDNLEVILVDDCSKDNTIDTIKKYSQTSPLNIHIIKNDKNIGAGSSRNVGLSIASKEYITFIDADDIVFPGFFHEINAILEKNRYDCVIFDAVMRFEDIDKKVTMFYGGDFSEGKIGERDAFVFINGTTWGKAYRTKMIQSNNVRFADLMRNEDMVFTKVALSFCREVYYHSVPLYVYRDNAKSLMHDDTLLDKNNAITGYELVQENICKAKDYTKELNGIYLMEVVYSTTMTAIKQNKKMSAVREWYNSVKEKYDSHDKYASRLIQKYRILLVLFRLNLFFAVKLAMRCMGE